MKHKNPPIERHNLKPQDVKPGMCVYPKMDINIDGIKQMRDDPCIIFKNTVYFYKANADNYTWQKINGYKQSRK